MDLGGAMSMGSFFMIAFLLGSAIVGLAGFLLPILGGLGIVWFACSVADDLSAIRKAAERDSGKQ